MIGRANGPSRAGGVLGTVLAAGTLYFLVVFGCGFVLGIVRSLWLVPLLGERWAELVEIPVMLIVVYLGARWIGRRFSLGALGRRVKVGVGLVGLALLVGAELGLVLVPRSISLAEYVAERDPVSGTAYAVSLLIFAAMPVLVRERPRISEGERGLGSPR